MISVSYPIKLIKIELTTSTSVHFIGTPISLNANI